MALNFKSLLTRALTAGVFVAVLLSAICYNYISFTVLFFIFSIWGLYEFYKIAELLGAKPFKLIGHICGIILYTCGTQSNLFQYYCSYGLDPIHLVFAGTFLIL